LPDQRRFSQDAYRENAKQSAAKLILETILQRTRRVADTSLSSARGS
jgi:hypothetical protein